MFKKYFQNERNKIAVCSDFLDEAKLLPKNEKMYVQRLLKKEMRIRILCWSIFFAIAGFFLRDANTLTILLTFVLSIFLVIEVAIIDLIYKFSKRKEIVFQDAKNYALEQNSKNKSA